MKTGIQILLTNTNKKNYSQALNLLEKSRPTLQRFNDFSRTAMADYYLGMCYFDMGTPQKGIEYLKKWTQFL